MALNAPEKTLKLEAVHQGIGETLLNHHLYVLQIKDVVLSDLSALLKLFLNLKRIILSD